MISSTSVGTTLPRGVSEYWLIDPRDDSVTVLSLVDGEYEVTSAPSRKIALSQRLDGFECDAARAFSRSASDVASRDQGPTADWQLVDWQSGTGNRGGNRDCIPSRSVIG